MSSSVSANRLRPPAGTRVSCSNKVTATSRIVGRDGNSVQHTDTSRSRSKACSTAQDLPSPAVIHGTCAGLCSVYDERHPG